MPYARRTRNRTYRRRRRAAKRGVGSFSKAPMPNIFRTKLRYVEAYDLNPGLATPGVQVISANGCHDPDITGIGHQPRGFDQLMAMYDHYVVLGAKVTVMFTDKSGVSNNSGRIGIALKDSSTAPLSLNDYSEGRNVVTRSFVHDQNHSTTLTKTFSAKKFLGRQSVMSDPHLKGSASANPAEGAYFHIFYQPYTGADTGGIWGDVRIDYLVALIEPKQPSQS